MNNYSLVILGISQQRKSQPRGLAFHLYRFYFAAYVVAVIGAIVVGDAAHACLLNLAAHVIAIV